MSERTCPFCRGLGFVLRSGWGYCRCVACRGINDPPAPPPDDASTSSPTGPQGA